MFPSILFHHVSFANEAATISISKNEVVGESDHEKEKETLSM